VLLEPHLQRLARSSVYFGFACDSARVRAALLDQATKFAGDTAQRVRLTLARDGELRISADVLTDTRAPKRFVVSQKTIDARDPMYGHKTTRRALYDSEFARAQREQGAYEVLFFNKRGELVEGSRTNVFLELEGLWRTPPLSSGCLPGVMREQVLAQRAHASEKVLRREDLARASRIWLCNAVRGVVEVSLLEASGAVQHKPVFQPTVGMPAPKPK